MNLSVAEGVVADLRLPAPIHKIEFLDKGYSSDRKYLLQTPVGVAYLLRLSPVEEASTRRVQYDAMVKVRAAGVPCSDPVAFGVDEERGVCYTVLGYVDGEAAEDALLRMGASERYRFGLDAGEQLRVIHASVAPPGPVDDYEIRGGKYARHKREAAECGFHFSGMERADAYVEANLHLLRSRETTFRHGDYHPGNLIVRDGLLAGVIDFNRSDFGDPIDDFYKTAWFGAPLSREYAKGLLEGYFGGEPTEDFWKLYNLYVAAAMPADLVWTHRLYPRELARTFDLIEDIARTHDLESGGPPAWWGCVAVGR